MPTISASSGCEYKVRAAVEKVIKEGKGIVVVIGSTFTGKTYYCKKLLKELGVQEIDIDYEEIKTQGMKKMISQYSSDCNSENTSGSSTNIVSFFGSGVKSKVGGPTIFYCDAL